MRRLTGLLVIVFLLFPAAAAHAAPPPPQPLVDRSTLSILRGEGQYFERARGPIVAAVGGQDVAVGDRVITGPDTSAGQQADLAPGETVLVQPDALLSAVSVSEPFWVEGPLGPAKVLVSPVEIALLG